MNHIHISVNGKTIVDETQNDSQNFKNNSVSFFSTQKIVKKQKKKNKKDDIVYYCGLFGDIHAMNKNSLLYKFTNFVWFCIFMAIIISISPYVIIFLVYFILFLVNIV
ncbi:MAG: hypothetical protein LBL62_00930, partial [Planctomycetaceae bacterium]|nr:hypothetical protein [Planctomycetaceae bacterium]